MSDRVVPGNPKPITNADLLAALAGKQDASVNLDRLDGTAEQQRNAINAPLFVGSKTATEWETENAILSEGAIGYDETHRQIKIGDGFNTWRNLHFPSLDRVGKTSLGDPADTAPSSFTAEQKATFREPLQTLLFWTPSTIENHGVLDQSVIYWEHGYNTFGSVHNEPRCYMAFESQWFGFMEWHHAVGRTKPYTDNPIGKYFRCDSATYPRDRFDHPTAGADVSSGRAFSYNRIEFKPLWNNPLDDEQYNGSPHFSFDFRAQQSVFSIANGSIVRFNDIDTPQQKQLIGDGSTFVDLPYINGSGETVLASDTRCSGTVRSNQLFATTKILVGTEANENGIALSNGIFAGYNTYYGTGSFRRRNAVQASAVDLNFSGVDIYYGGFAAADSAVPIVARFDSTGLILNGVFNAPQGVIAYSFSDAAGSGLRQSGGNLQLWENNVLALNIADIIKQVRFPADYAFGWASLTSNLAASDTSLSRNSAGVVQVGTTSNNAAGSLLLTNLTASGVIIQQPAASTTLSVNNQMVFERVSNTQIRLKLRGDDGVSRSITFTLS